MPRVIKDIENSSAKVTEFNLFKNFSFLEEINPDKEPEQAEAVAETLEDNIVNLEDELIRSEQLEQEKQQTLLEQVDDILAKAVQEAEEIIANAKKIAEKVKSDAYDEGFNLGRIEGMEKGAEEGRAEAVLTAEENNKKELLKLQSHIMTQIAEVNEEKEKAISRHLNDLKDISVAIGEKIVHTSLKSSKDVIEKMIITATEKMKKSAWAKIYIGKGEKAGEIQGDVEFLKALSNIADNVKVVIMEEEEPGTCIIETPEGIMDISVKTQLDNIREIIINAKM